MTRPELAHLELLAELDELADALNRWAESAPDWPPARTCRAIVRRLREKLGTMRLRLEAPLVVATLGGTGVGKSALVNALAGGDVAETGRSRPTTRLPTLICRSDITPAMLGIDPASVTLVQRNLPALANLVIIDCPDPDTTEAVDASGTNLARLRRILPYCDVLLVATTQQKYRSARVANELAMAASGARLVFVQTHADQDQDIRDDWRNVLEPHYQFGHIFLVDSLAALADIENGREPRGEFAGLLELLTRQLAGSASARIRRANLLDLIEDTLALCRHRIEEAAPAVRQVFQAIAEQRIRLASRLAEQMRTELLASRRQWENRLLGQVASRWGFSPFALAIRVYHGLGGLFSSALLFRARTPAQLALWGVFEGARALENRRTGRRADAGAARAVTTVWGEAELRSASIVLDGYALEAGLNRLSAGPEIVFAEAAEAGQSFVAGVSAELDSLIGRVAQRHTGWLTRWRYEFLFLAILAVLLYRPAKNFFYDSWLASPPVELLGLNFYVLSAFWLALGCIVLLWSLSSRLRRGLRREIDQLAEGWKNPLSTPGVFRRLEAECEQAERFRGAGVQLEQHVAGLRRHVEENGGAEPHPGIPVEIGSVSRQTQRESH